jgi:hypothetical protein
MSRYSTLPGLVFGLVLFDFANGKSARYSVVAEQNPEASVFVLADAAYFGRPQHHRNVRQTTLPNLYQAAGQMHQARTHRSL